MASTPSTHPRLQPPAAVVDISRALERAGFTAWCVGGAVRDALLGQPHLDWDFATNATPDQVRSVFGRRRTIPVGIAFGTVGVLDATGIMHEVTTFRRDVRTDGRHAEVEFGATLEEDLARRDFTINAIAFSATTGELRDPFGGRKDLERGVVRAVGMATERMREDYLRALRGLRFAARFGFEIETSTWSAIRGSAPYLTRLSAERIRQELEKTMDQVAAPSRAMALWRDAGAVTMLLPELEPAGDEARRAVDCAARPGLPRRPGRRLVRFALLFSDCNAEAALATSLRLRFPKRDAQWIEALVAAWQVLDAPMSDTLMRGSIDGPAIRRWIARIGRMRLAAFFRLADARWSARREVRGSTTAPAPGAARALYRRCRRAALADPVDRHDLAVDGDDLRRAGVPAGPELGRILDELVDLVIEDPALNTRERLLAEVRRLQDGDA